MPEILSPSNPEDVLKNWWDRSWGWRQFIVQTYTMYTEDNSRTQRHLQNLRGGELCGLVFLAYAVSCLKEKQSSSVAFSHALVFD